MCLSGAQRERLAEHKRRLHEERQQELQAEFRRQMAHTEAVRLSPCASELLLRRQLETFSVGMSICFADPSSKCSPPCEDQTGRVLGERHGHENK